MSELLPCPFCGGEIEHQLMMDGAYSFTCHQCGLNARWADDIARAVPEMIDSTEKRWNTRHERTCHVSSSQYEPSVQLWIVTLSCGHEHLLPFEELDVSYCSECGAKVVD